MKHRIFALCVLVSGFAATARAQVQALPPAQAPGTFTNKCNPNLVSYQFSPTQVIWTFNCTTDAAINGVAFTGLTYSLTSEGNAAAEKNWGVMVGTLANGDQVFFEIQGVDQKTSATSNAGTMSYKIVGGTGIANGISGSGTCKTNGAQGKGGVQTCAGAYAIR